jgi:hypothetical protein
LDEVDWQPARRLAPDRARQKRAEAGRQARLFADEGDAAVG